MPLRSLGLARNLLLPRPSRGVLPLTPLMLPLHIPRDQARLIGSRGQQRWLLPQLVVALLEKVDIRNFLLHVGVSRDDFFVEGGLPLEGGGDEGGLVVLALVGLLVALAAGGDAGVLTGEGTLAEPARCGKKRSGNEKDGTMGLINTS